MLLRLLPGCLAATSLLAIAPAASADPITLRYEVTVSHRADPPFSPNRPFVRIDPISFPLSMTFDGDLISHNVTLPDDPSDPNAQSHWVTNFGPASFSSVPLPADPGAGSGNTAVFNSIVGGQPLQTARATQQVGSGSMQVVAPGLRPPLAAGEFGTLDTFLRAMNSSNLEFFFAGAGAAGPFFFGRADAVDTAAPVPEPATMTLLGAAVAVAALRRRQRT